MRIAEFEAIKKKAPWNIGADWKRLTALIRQTDQACGSNLESVRLTAGQIQRNYEKISPDIQAVCEQTCPECKDICCVRATVWFDFKDLLTIYFASGQVPPRQIYKQQTVDFKACCHLTENGCCLPRWERPFVCTWYVCPDQKSRVSKDIDRCILEIKALRSSLGSEYFRVISSQ